MLLTSYIGKSPTFRLHRVRTGVSQQCDGPAGGHVQRRSSGWAVPLPGVSGHQRLCKPAAAGAQTPLKRINFSVSLLPQGSPAGDPRRPWPSWWTFILSWVYRVITKDEDMWRYLKRYNTFGAKLLVQRQAAHITCWDWTTWQIRSFVSVQSVAISEARQRSSVLLLSSVINLKPPLTALLTAHTTCHALTRTHSMNQCRCLTSS